MFVPFHRIDGGITGCACHELFVFEVYVGSIFIFIFTRQAEVYKMQLSVLLIVKWYHNILRLEIFVDLICTVQYFQSVQ